jgi:hypothetical protein
VPIIPSSVAEVCDIGHKVSFQYPHFTWSYILHCSCFAVIAVPRSKFKLFHHLHVNSKRGAKECSSESSLGALGWRYGWTDVKTNCLNRQNSQCVRSRALTLCCQTVDRATRNGQRNPKEIAHNQMYRFPCSNFWVPQMPEIPTLNGSTTNRLSFAHCMSRSQPCLEQTYITNLIQYI